MEKNNIAVEYKNKFTKPSIIVGSITVALAMVTSFLPSIYLYLTYGVFPDVKHLLTAWGGVLAFAGAFYIVEPMSYFPIFGITGTYIGILSGNIPQIRVPAAATAQDIMEADPSTPKGEIVGVLAICGSVVTNIIMLTAAVLAGSFVLSKLPAAVSDAMSSYLIPALFGACFTMFAVKKIKVVLYAVPIAVVLLLLKAPGWLCIVGCILGVLAITYILYKKKKLD